MHVRHGFFDGTTNVEIGVAGKGRVNTALQADLRRTAIPGFLCAAGYFIHVQQIGVATQAVAAFALRERAELAPIGAHVRVVDIAVNNVANGIARDFEAQFIRGLTDVVKISITCRKQRDYLSFNQLFATTCFVGYGAHKVRVVILRWSLAMNLLWGQHRLRGKCITTPVTRCPFVFTRQPGAVGMVQNGLE